MKTTKSRALNLVLHFSVGAVLTSAVCGWADADLRGDGTLHWSQTEPFGYNVPRGLRNDTLDDVRDKLAAANVEVTQGATKVILTRDDIGDHGFVGTMVKFPDGHIQINAGTTQLRSGDAGRT